MFDLTGPLNGQPAQTLQQSDGYARMLGLLGVQTSRIAGCLALHRRVLGVPLTMIPRFSGPPDAVLAALPRNPVILSPDHPAPDLARRAIRLARPVPVAELDLWQDADLMLAAMQGKWRNRLRHGEQQGLRVRASVLPPDPDHWLLRAEDAQARRRGYRNWPAALTYAWARANPRGSLLVEARQGRNIIAALLFLRHGDGATYHIGHGTAEGRKASAHNLLLWHAMQMLARQGVTRLDLGRLHRRSLGLTRFKLGSGARMRQLGGTWGGHPLG